MYKLRILKPGRGDYFQEEEYTVKSVETNAMAKVAVFKLEDGKFLSTNCKFILEEIEDEFE